AKEHAVGVDKGPQRLLVAQELIAAFVRLDRGFAFPGLVQPELVRVFGRSVHPEGEIARFPTLDATGVHEQEREHVLGLAFLGDHPYEVANRRHRRPSSRSSMTDSGSRLIGPIAQGTRRSA